MKGSRMCIGGEVDVAQYGRCTLATILLQNVTSGPAISLHHCIKRCNGPVVMPSFQTRPPKRRYHVLNHNVLASADMKER